MAIWKQQLFDGYVTTGQAHPFLKSYPLFENITKKHLPKDKSIAIADLACGNGNLLYILKKYGYTNVAGADISQEQIDIAHQHGIKEAICQDIYQFLDEKADQSLDIIFLMDILEHLDRQELFDLLGKVQKSLKPGGKVIIHVPNGFGIFGMGIRYGDYTHETAFTPKSMAQILSSCKFEKVQAFEDEPIIHGVKSFVRFILWRVLSYPFRLLLLAETGSLRKKILSQNMLVIAAKA